MRYVKHLGEGSGFVWNLGEAPLDGGTDFLFAVASALLYSITGQLAASVQLLSLSGHLGTIALVYLYLRRRWPQLPWLAAFIASILALGPGLAYVAMHFGTPLFAFAACLAWCIGLDSLSNRLSWWHAMGFSLSALITGLIRPEGVFLAGFMLLSLLLLLAENQSRQRLFTAAVLVLGLLGLCFFLWRWQYFGQPFPNPYYKKGGGDLHLGSLLSSVRNAMLLLLPLSPLLALAICSTRRLKRLGLLIFPPTAFVLLWILLSDEMNTAMRFQYVVLPLVAVTLPHLLRDEDLRSLIDLVQSLTSRSKLMLVALLAILLLLLLGVQVLLHPYGANNRDGRLAVAGILRAYGSDNLTLLTTEAGLLPLYSEWRSVDAWGLNDREIARHGLTLTRLESESPDVIVFHAYTSPLCPTSPSVGPWNQMVEILREYASTQDYELAASFGPHPCDTHYYYVSREMPRHEQLVAAIWRVDYPWFGNGIRVYDFARLCDSLNCDEASS
jgi:hypothetical protein